MSATQKRLQQPQGVREELGNYFSACAATHTHMPTPAAAAAEEEEEEEENSFLLSGSGGGGPLPFLSFIHEV